MKKRYVEMVLGIGMSVCVGSPTWAIGNAGIGNEVLSARSAGQGYVGIAGQNQDPMTTYSNPAALTNLKGTQATAIATWENVNSKYVDSAGNETKARTSNDVVPSFAVTHNFGGGDSRDLTVGLSLESPYGLETKWRNDSAVRYVATNSSLKMIILSPAIAARILPTLSMGAGADYVNVFEASLERHLADPLGGPDGNSRLEGKGTNWGYHAGLLFEPNERHAFGITYHSRVKVRLNGSVTLSDLSSLAAVFGDSQYTTSAYTDIFLPQNVQFGYAFKPTSRLTLEANTAWYDWAPNCNLDVRFSETDPTRQSVLQVGNPTPFDWRDAWGFAAGANYKWTEKTQVRGGLWYEPWVQPESTFSPTTVDLSRYGLAAGIGYAITSSLTVDFAYNAIFFHNRHVHNTVGTNTSGIPGYDINGVYKDFAHLVSLGFTYRFIPGGDAK